MNSVLVIGFQALPVHEHFESGQGKGQARLEVRPPAMPDLFEVTAYGHHRQHGPRQHRRVSASSATENEIDRVVCAIA